MPSYDFRHGTLARFQLHEIEGLDAERTEVVVSVVPAGFRVVVVGGCLCSLEGFPEVVDGAGEAVFENPSRALDFAAQQFEAIYLCFDL